MEVENQISDPTKFNNSSMGHYKSHKISNCMFEIRVIYLRIVSSSDMQNSMKIVFPSRDLKTCLQINGLKIDPSVKISRNLNRHRSEALIYESIYVNTDLIKLGGPLLPFEIHMKGSSVLVSGVLRRNRDRFNGSTDGCMWLMECKEGEITEIKRGGLVDVFFAGNSGRPVILNGVVELKKRWKGLNCIPEDDETINFNSKESESEEKLNKEFDDGCSDPHYEVHEEMFVEEDDEELPWFNAGVRVGMGLGLGMCLGVGVGLGLGIKTYQATSRAFRRFI
ncbi:uncharacterized protein At1g01500-like [Tasmannia lanceolata]|uniref:uncharacterized protein At1g01500-like n=1 Tax=Tasmannia lanceolata TaxID=3420 RepID=UPI0040645BFD